MSTSVFELFKVGIGPSSSHTVGPMRAARAFAESLRDGPGLEAVAAVRIELFGSLAATGYGHGTPGALVLGLIGERPESVDPDVGAEHVRDVRESSTLRLLVSQEIPFDLGRDVVLRRGRRLPRHPNAMRFTAAEHDGEELLATDYYSIGGGFILSGEEADEPSSGLSGRQVPYPFTTAAELLAQTRATGLPISELVLANEMAESPREAIRERILYIWEVMQQCVRRGCSTEGVLPGGLEVPRRAARLAQTLEDTVSSEDPLRAMEWVELYALAVNEENAAGGRVVTAPTNGAAGIVPAVLHYYTRFVPGAGDDGVERFLLTASAIGSLCKRNASISGAEVGCQGEVGSASAMAAAGLAEVLGGSPEQVENAAEIAMEHNLGLTCDPVGGLVQIPCIERNAIGAVQAVAAARLALHGDGVHHVSLDTVIRTMRDTGRDMSDKYKETSRGGLAVSVPEC
ncbi:MAG: L-serine ammonia-lyase [Actinomycetota bacterium]|nr:L-serine ammonia-lyase [Actinomycetota bacterium]